MQIHSLAIIIHLVIIAAFICAITYMQGLEQVTTQVEKDQNIQLHLLRAKFIRMLQL
jgi:hypothetical protein